MNCINKVSKRVLLNMNPFKCIKHNHTIKIITHSISLRYQSSATHLQSEYNHQNDTETIETLETIQDGINPLKNKEFLWVSDMTQFWESLNFNKYNIDILINLGHGKYSDPKLLSSLKIDIAKFAEYTLEECKHLRSPNLAQRYLENVQKIFPNMILNKAIYYNPYFLTLTLLTIKKRKMDLIDVISTHLSQTTNPNKYNYLFFKQNKDTKTKNIEKYNEEYLNKSEIIELIDWDKFFENVSNFLTKDFGEIIKEIHVLKKLLCVNYTNNMGLTQIELIELFEVYPNILKTDYLSLLSKFRFFMEFGSGVILRKQKYFFFDDIDLTQIGTDKSLLNEEIICSAYKLSIKYLISNGWIFNYSWVRLQRLKYLIYNPQLRRKYSIKEIMKMKSNQFVNVADVCWKDYCQKTKRKYEENVNLDENWRDKDIDRYLDYEEFIKCQLRAQINTIIKWNGNNIDDTKLLLKKNKSKLRKPFMEKYKKNKQQIKEEEELEDEVELIGNKTIFSLADKQERKEYLHKMKRLEQLNGRLCRNIYATNAKDIKNFLSNANDFGFNYPLKDDLLDNENSEMVDIDNDMHA